MATAVIVAALRKRGVAVSGKSEDLRMDEDGDGLVSDAEIAKRLDKVSLTVDIMQQRLALERDMAEMCMKLPFFLVVFFCFLSAMNQIAPAASVARVHRHLKTHFNLDSITGIKDYAGIYDYIGEFAHANIELQATSSRYWCETRYTQLAWDPHLHMPTTRCASPRLYSIGLGDAAYAWSALRAASNTPAPSAGHDDDEHHRRMLAESCVGEGCGRGVARPPPVGPRNASATPPALAAAGRRASSESPHHADDFELGASSFDDGSHASHIDSDAHEVPCEDNDAGLQVSVGDDFVTCQANSAALCDSDAGMSFCPATCGYCGPFTYEHLRKYDKTQVTLLPPVIYQTRFETKECQGYAEHYESQRHNPVLRMLPPLDGQRNGHVLTCIDRSKHFTGSYALSLRCPEWMGGVQCEESDDFDFPILRDTPSVDFDGKKVYPKFLTDEHATITQMKEFGWLDAQTDKVTLSTLVYTADREIFTSVKVNFATDAAANIDASYDLVSYSEMTGGVSTQFVVCCVLCLLGSAMATVIAVVGIVRDPSSVGGSVIFQLLCRALMFFYVLYLVISWSLQHLMAEEFDLLLNVMLDFEGGSSEEFRQMLQDFFGVIEILMRETQWLMRNRITAYVIMYMQFVMLILIFSAHPRMAVLTSTVSKCAQSMIHFLVLFFSLFLNLAFIAHWMLGEHIPVFDTYSGTVEAMARMLFGEFIYASGAEKLDAQFSAMYWIFAFTFMLVVFFTLLNFFLAIVVDAYVAVKDELADAKTHLSFPEDCLDVLMSFMVYKNKGWPSRARLLTFFGEKVTELAASEGRDPEAGKQWVDFLNDSEEGESNVLRIVPEALLHHFPEEFQSNDDVAAFVGHYYRKCKLVIRLRREDQDIGSRPTTGASNVEKPCSPPWSPPVAWPEAQQEDSGKGAFPAAPVSRAWEEIAPKSAAQNSGSPQAASSVNGFLAMAPQIQGNAGDEVAPISAAERVEAFQPAPAAENIMVIAPEPQGDAYDKVEPISAAEGYQPAPVADNVMAMAPQTQSNACDEAAPISAAETGEASQPNLVADNPTAVADNPMADSRQSFGVSAPPEPVAVAPAQKLRMYRVIEEVDIKLRKGPDMKSALAGEKVHFNDTFEISSVKEVGSQLWLEMADGRGWVLSRHPKDNRVLVAEESPDGAPPPGPTPPGSVA